MSELQAITKCSFTDPVIEKSDSEGKSHLLKMVVMVGNEDSSKELIFHIRAAKNGRGWELHEPSVQRIESQIQEEGFDPETFNIALFKCRAVSMLNRPTN